MSFPLRRSLASQVAAYLRERIADGSWQTSLPPERQLALLCKVSRTVVRAALEILRKEKVIVAGMLYPSRIAVPPSRSPQARKKVVHFLNLIPLEKTTLENVLQIDELRETLYRNDFHLELLVNRRIDWNRPEKFLERMVGKTKSACWILNSPGLAVQRWFQERSIPAVISGSPYPGIALPYVDNDWQSVARHAAGLFARSGHLRVALLAGNDERAGDLLLKRCFLETLSQLAPEVECVVEEHELTPHDAFTATRKLLRRTWPPTVIFATHASNGASALSAILQQRLRVPRDVSLVFRSYSRVLEDLFPSPTCYKVDIAGAGRALAQLARTIGECEGALKPVLFVPTFEKGNSFARRRAGEPLV